MNQLLQFLIAIDQLLNTMIPGGYADESVLDIHTA